MNEKTAPSGSEPTAVLATFLAMYVSDEEAGQPRPLGDYQALFPGFEEVIAAEYAGLLDPGTGGADTPPAPSAGALMPAMIGRYRPIREVGRGGQSVVYLAEDSTLDRRVALKVLPPTLLPSERSRDRFRREAEIAARLDHPGVCVIHETGEHEGMPFIAMRHIDGESLAEHISTARTQSLRSEELTFLELPDAPEPDAESIVVPPEATPDRQEITRIVGLIEKTARALHAAHETGLLHRDVKPGNIMVTPDGEPVLLDFGLARDEMRDGKTLTQSGDLMGTPAYMSPEQLLAQRIRLDRRSDVYSLGVTLYESLTLTRPFDAPTREALYQQILGGEVPDPRRINPDISRDLQVVLQTALEKDRNRRYPSALAFAEDLQRIRQFLPITARPAGPVLRVRRWTRRNPVTATAGAALVIVLIGGLVASALVNARLARTNENLQATRANLEQSVREKNAALGESRGRRLAAQALEALNHDHTLALHLAIHARETSANLETDRVLRMALERSREMRVIAAHDREVLSIDIDQAGARVASVGWDNRMRTWDLNTGERLVDFDGRKKAGKFERSLHDGFFVGDTDTIGLFSNFPFSTVDLATGTEVEPEEITDSRVAYSPDGRFVASTEATVPEDRENGQWRYAIRMTELATGAEVFRVETQAPFLRMKFSRDGSRLLAGSGRKQCFVFDARTGQQLQEFPVRVRYAVLNPDGTLLAGAIGPGEVGVHRVADASMIASIFLEDRSAWPLSLAFDHEGQRLAVPEESGAIHVHHLDRIRRPDLTLRGPIGWIRDMEFTPDGKRLVSAHDDGSVRVWDVSQRDSVASGADFSGRGWTSAPSTSNEQVTGWSYRSGSSTELPTGELRILGPGGQELWRRDVIEYVGTCISSDGRHVLVASRRDGLTVFDGPSGSIIRSFGHAARANGAALDHQGERVATAGADGLVRIWSIATGEELKVLEGHVDKVLDVSFSPCGNWIASSSEDRTSRAWNAHTGDPVAVFLDDDLHRNPPAWSADSTHVRLTIEGPADASGSTEYRYRVLPLDPLEGARERLARSLTEAERARYLD